MELAARAARRELEKEKKKNNPKKLGKLKFTEPNIPVKLTEELQGSLRLLKVRTSCEQGSNWEKRGAGMEKITMFSPSQKIVTIPVPASGSPVMAYVPFHTIPFRAPACEWTQIVWVCYITARKQWWSNICLLPVTHWFDSMCILCAKKCVPKWGLYEVSVSLNKKASVCFGTWWLA